MKEYFDNLDIPYEVVVFTVKQEIWDKYLNNSDKFFRTVIIDKDKVTKSKGEKIISSIKAWNSTGEYEISDDDIEKNIIINKDFYLTIIKDPVNIYFGNYYCTEVRVSNKQLKVSYPITACILRDEIINLISSCSYVNNYKINGKFVYKNDQSFRQYNPEDKNFLNNIERAKLLGTKRKTTILIPGHKYLLKNKKEIIYLGSINRGRYRNDYSWRDEEDHSYFYYSKGNSYSTYFTTKETYLYLNLDNIYNFGYSKDIYNLSEYLESLKGKPICDFVVDWIDYCENNFKDLKHCISFRKNISGVVDLGEYLSKSGASNLDDTLCSICFDKLIKDLGKSSPEISKFLYGLNSSYLSKLSDENKTLIFNTLEIPFLKELFGKYKYRFNEVQWQSLKNETDPKAIYNIMLKSLGRYYLEELESIVILKNSIFNIMFSEDRLNTLIIECKKAYVK